MPHKKNPALKFMEVSKTDEEKVLSFNYGLSKCTRQKKETKFRWKFQLPQNKLSKVRPMLVLIAWTRRERRQQERALIWEHIVSCSCFLSNPHVPVSVVKMVFEWIVWFNCIHSFAKHANFYIDSFCPLQSQFFAWSCGIRNRRIWVFMTLFASLWDHMIVKSANKLAWGQRFFY